MKSLLRLTALITACTLVSHAHAAFVFTVSQVGSDVVVTGLGTLDTAGFTLSTTNETGASPYISPEGGALQAGTLTDPVDAFSGFTGPENFGPGFSTLGTGTGDYVGIDSDIGTLFAPENYVSGTSLSNSLILTNTTISAVGATPGTYTWSWGTGSNADSLSINVVPEPSAWAMLLGGAGLLGAATRKRRTQAF